MELTTLLVAALIGLGVLGADAVLYRGSVAVEVTEAPKLEKLEVGTATLANQFEGALDEILSTESVVRPPEIRSSRDQGLGMALAEAANVQNIAFALQSEFGYNPDRLRFSLYVEDGALRGLVSGSSHTGVHFQQVMTPNPGETIVPFVRRCALWGGSQLAPYATALHLIEEHAGDQNFADAVAMIGEAKEMLPPTPVSFDRSLFDNLLGLIALFKNDAKAAQAAFATAMAEDTANSVAFLNAAFTDLLLDQPQAASDRMEQVLRLAPPANATLRATAYTTWAAARLGLRDAKGADMLLAQATQIDPTSATAFGLWAEAKTEEGDAAAAERYNRRAAENTATFENYAEVAALYFRLSWKDNEPMIRNRFANPTVVTFH